MADQNTPPVIISDLEEKDAEVVRTLVDSRVSGEDSWRIAVDNLKEPLTICEFCLCSVLLFCLTGSVLYSLSLSLITVSVIHLCVIRPLARMRFLQNQCPDLCGDSKLFYESWCNIKHGSRLVVAKIGDQVVGTGAVVRLSDTSAEIKRVAVTSQCAGRGIGKRIMEALMEHCKQVGFSDVIVQVSSNNTKALAFYKKLGFQNHEAVEHDKFLEYHWIALRLKRQL